MNTPTEPQRFPLYPATVPFRSGRLKVSGGHELHFEECGSPVGKPVVVLHGGPGAGVAPVMRRFHDPRLYRIVLFDQRGCGRSLPHAAIEHNTTWDLVADMEALRAHLDIETWQVFGGSWGSALALAYAQTHPDRVRELILRGIFLMRRSELDWFYRDGCNWLFPEAFAEFTRAIPENERGDLIGAYYKRLTSPDEDVRLAAARAWTAWEGRTLSLLPDHDRERHLTADYYALALARIECHYVVHGGFFEDDGQLLCNADRLSAIPGTIVHGRYDVVTPMKNAFDLANAWPAAELRVVPDAGHAMTEPGIVHALIAATRTYAGD
ncbi:proline iminopeptidase [Methyloceanibacter methanicus]|uniref:Proline iminopeptidase n=1 Tax=Methyloceanibacter methanicus TaxID=1774968 RepID=A0A1E3W2R4_9HYPH|nr:prolyl aminopeptidase [Methyloceanibacter methanicus]ODS00071.1 proline iminopeptidase [Methyloceanibacter methanicus]